MNIQLDGIRLHALSDGNGAAIVLLHGFPLTHAIWNAQIESLAKTARFVAPDLRGMGKSDAPPGPYLMENLAADIAALLDALQIPRASIIGHSMGGFAALAFFRMFSERVASLGLICSRVDADTNDGVRVRLELADRIEREGMQPAVDFYIARLLRPRGSAELVNTVAHLIRTQAPAGAAALLRGAAARASSEDLLEDIDVPTLIVCGSEDTISPPDYNRSVAARIQNSEMKVIERSAHLPMLENSDAMCDALKGFLRRSGSIAM